MSQELENTNEKVNLSIEPVDGQQKQGIHVPELNITDLVFQPGPNHEERLAAVLKVQEQKGNALLEAASVLLRCLAEMPDALDEKGVRGLLELLRQEMQSFTRICEQANIRREHMLAARYVLCTALDESANLRNWGGGGDKASTGVWSTQALLNTFHSEGEGGKIVFLLIGRLANSPSEHVDVLEVIHHVLSLGFMGDYRVQTDGHRMFETIRHRLYTMVSANRESVPRELSPHWRGVTAGKLHVLRSLPVWLTASVLSIAVFAQFGWYKYQLALRVSAVEKHTQAVSQWKTADSPVATKALRLAEILSPEIASGRVKVDEAQGRSVVIFKGDGMFAGGLYKLSPSSRTTIEKVAEALNDVPGKVRVLGHTDNVPMTKGLSDVTTNLELSEKRAQAVSQVLTEKGVDPSRIVSVGLGDTQPIAPNETAVGRGMNRRVAIEVLASEDAASGAKK
ncbi:MAG: type IVB secretion system protein IcmH/DotU [Limnohabitans sp.]